MTTDEMPHLLVLSAEIEDEEGPLGTTTSTSYSNFPWPDPIPQEAVDYIVAAAALNDMTVTSIVYSTI